MTEARIERRLAAILAADVAGYSRLMGIDEEGTLTALKGLRRELIDPKIAEHRGRMVKTTGDGMLIEFASAVDAVRFAMDIQRVMAERNATTPEDRRIEFRIGINVGDIIVDEGDIYGDGVNIAARVEPLAASGAICISDNVYQQIKGKFTLDVSDMGEHQLKNIAQAVRVYGVRLDGTSTRPALALPDKPSIAVLPFQNMSGDPQQEYFADGVVEDIITGLSRIKWFFVIARNSSFAYKGRAIDVKRIGSELGVRYVLEGSVRKSGDRVRITTQLIDSVTGSHVWAERYDRKYDDIFALQDDITSSVVGAMEPNLRLAEIERAKRKRPESLTAYDLVLQAHADTFSRMPAQSKKALVLLNRALLLDSTYALAHAFAAECHHSIYLRENMREEHRLEAIRHAEAAVACGQDDATALTFAGFTIGMEGRDRATALTLFEQALLVSPSSAHTYLCGSIVLAFGGQAERAIEWAERALRLSPFDPWRATALIGLAFGRFHLGQYEDAVAAARKAVQASPGFSIAYVAFAAPLVKIGSLAEAKSAATKLLELQPTFRFSRHFAELAVAPELATALGDALRLAGLPN
ncbi:MAG: adenylate/guanylate cyclase domain-containing protein [Xanthobacteraceae bacterium]